MTRWFVIAPISRRHPERCFDVEHQWSPSQSSHHPTGKAQRQRWRHRQHHIGSLRRAKASRPTSAVNPANPRARAGILVLSVGNG